MSANMPDSIEEKTMKGTKERFEEMTEHTSSMRD